MTPLEEDIFFTSAGTSSNTQPLPKPAKLTPTRSPGQGADSKGQRKPNLAGLERMSTKRGADSDSDWEDMDDGKFIMCIASWGMT